MSTYRNEEEIALVRDLVRKLTHFEGHTAAFSHCEEYILSRIARADTMSFMNKKEIDTTVNGLAEKFQFHGFKPQAEELRRYYERFLPKELTKAQLDEKLNVVRFLICLSESPTKYFLEHPSREAPVEKEERVDWSAYLKDGIERWSPSYTSSSDGWTDDSGNDHDDGDDGPSRLDLPDVPPNIEIPNEHSYIQYQDLKQKIVGSVQSGWFTKNNFQEIPESTNVDARISFHWDEFVEHASHGLITQRSTTLSEYKVMREVIWQLFVPHTSVCFSLVGNTLQPNENVTISSVRSVAFKDFCTEFLPYINTLEFFRKFRKSLRDTSESRDPPGIYVTYAECFREITKPFFEEVMKVEADLVKQESIMTLLRLASKLREISQDIFILKQIHNDVVLDYKTHTPVVCATTLLSRLRYGLLNNSTSKKEMDIYLTLYLRSLYRYFQIISWWFNYNNLVDSYNEFIITDSNSVPDNTNVMKCRPNSLANTSKGDCSSESISFYGDSTSHSELENNENKVWFSLRELDEFAAQDSILRIITTDVMQIGKNIRYLHMLHKLHLLKSNATKTLYDDFIAKIIQRISNYFKDNEDEEAQGSSTQCVPPGGGSEEQISFKFPAMCSDYVKYPTEMDRLENLVDTSDSFLMTAFKSFFTDKLSAGDEIFESLYSRISKITKRLFPIKDMLDDVFAEVFEERYSNSGFIVRDLLLKEHRLEEHFELLKYLYLFKDNLISTWYQKLFNQMQKGVHVDSDIWQMARLHDILMDVSPRLYERCTVQVADTWSFHRDPLRVCGLIHIDYPLNWPISIIIRKDQIKMYKDIFQFIMQIKWALHALNHLYISEIELQVQTSKPHKAITILLRRLKVYRFWLINDFSTINRYIMGYLYPSASAKLEANLHAASNLDVIISSHNEYINEIYKSSIRIRDYNHNSYGFKYLLYLVTKLRLMWSNLKIIDDRELVKFEKSYRICHNSLETVMSQDRVDIPVLLN